MNRVSFVVAGSSEYDYEVEIIRDGENLSAFCSCPAGVNGSHCKHRLAILSGDPGAVISGNREDVALAVEMLKGTSVEAAILAVEGKQHEFDGIQKELKSLKKKLGQSMRG